MPDLAKLCNLAGQLRDTAAKTRARGRDTGRWWRIENAGGVTAKVYLYGVIGEDFWGEGNTSAQFAAELNAITSPRVDLHINSEGGQVFEGIAIHSAIAAFPGYVTARIDGLAASAASFIAMAADRVEVERHAKMMVHDAATGFAMASGNAAGLREFAQEVLNTADLLDELSDTIAAMYAERAGGTVEHWRAVMRAETWYSAEKAVSAKLADGIVGESHEPPATPVVDIAAEEDVDASALLAALRGAWDA